VYITIPLYAEIMKELARLVEIKESSGEKNYKNPSPLDACNSIVKRLKNGK
jgi:hypothetical protein